MNTLLKIWAFCILCIGSAPAFTIGETLEEAYPAEQRKNTEVKKIGANGRLTHYKIVSTAFPNDYSFVTVSEDTSRICNYAIHGLESIYEVLTFASSICNGEVFMPESASGGKFYLKNTPGGKYEGLKFFITARLDLVGKPTWELEIECMDFAHSVPASFQGKQQSTLDRLKELRALRDKAMGK
jgi:hypothetical protein